ncbi:MAG: hypothetical protein G01um101425_343 [Candidatus Peregrinibacteria bacterium Gr01-1014_25]|nr:MAG: hypothetical protein G01um101425_343 [Candidatus Peregrinibacteria bacterium Gr01-1014_25]
MTIDACIAHAIQTDLDILEALPEVQEIPVEDLEMYIERYVLNIQRALARVIQERGEKFLKGKDAAGLCATCLEAGVNLPPSVLLKMCQTIIQLTTLDAELVLESQGTSLYYVKMAVG